MFMRLQIFATVLLLGFAVNAVAAQQSVTLLNVSYDPTREFYNAYNPLFIKYWKEKTGQDVKVLQSHGGSGKQARSVIDGLPADVVTLALAYDIDAIAEKSKLLPPDWQNKLPHNSSPYSSAIVFLVRKGNPKHIKDWDDLIRDNIQVITPNPKTSGGARWNYLAAWGYAVKKNNGSEDAAKAYIAQLFKHVPVLDAGARGATTTFIERGIGDVLIAWENEALLATHDVSKDKFEIIIPSISILAEPPVAVVEKNAAKKKTLEVAHSYLEHLYSQEAQELIAKNYCRPSDATVAAKYTAIFPELPLLTIRDFGGWKAAQAKHFADGGVFDQVFMK
jgi:sulfate transport system substrate-binding protein